MPFVEAFRQFQFRVGHQNFTNIHVSLVPQVSTSLLWLLELDVYRLFVYSLVQLENRKPNLLKTVCVSCVDSG